MSPSDVAVLILFLAGAVALVTLNVGLQRHGIERIAGCCGMVLPAEITDAMDAR